MWQACIKTLALRSCMCAASNSSVQAQRPWARGSTAVAHPAQHALQAFAEAAV